ncbi:embryonic protein UVS.2-like [Rana temporaria]|uniref:embryonic protein UVS.2-like n=1 Tax=Rana temporaria TaxID=8407 RepID=UPI001AAD5E66|nr:embryonic protein UVS.2-like [Rana temporaria]
MERNLLISLLLCINVYVNSAPIEGPGLLQVQFQAPQPAAKPPSEDVLRAIETINKAPQPTSELQSEDVMSTIERMNKGIGKLLHHSDIKTKEGRSAMECPSKNCFWSKSANGLVNVPYTVDPQFTVDEKATISRAILEFATLTCIRFVPRTSEADYVNIINDVGCWSLLGYSAGAQDLSLDRSGCVYHGVVQHELNHALGIDHEHSRSDRDLYIKILWQNIEPDYNTSFDKHNTNNLNMQYDYTSVMHYGKFAFSTDYRLQTIQPVPDNGISIGQRTGLSNLDVAKINKLYSCNICSSVLSDATGVLYSASNPSNYPNNYNCTWLIRLPISQILLQFKAFDVQNSVGCTSDYIRVFDGPSRTYPLLLDRSCGSGMMPSLVSSSSVMLVEFVTDGSITATGFKASYSTVSCGGTLVNSTGTVFSPGYEKQQNYPAYSDCIWTIIAPLGYKVQLAMVSFSLESSKTCSYDWLEIRDGVLSASPLVGPAYCGNQKIQPITSTKNGLVLHFVSDYSGQSTGFMAYYSIIPAS